MSAGLLSPVSAESSRGPRGRRRVRSPIISATSGDHGAIYYFLTEIFGGPTRAEYKASIDDPFCEPHDRLLLRRAGRIIAHAHVTHRVMQFGSVQIPTASLGWLASSPDHRRQGLATHLLSAAETYMARSGALVGLLATKIPHFFRRTGWALCGRHHFVTAGAHAVVSRLLDHGLRPGGHRRIHIRPWRRWEEGGIVRVYNQNLRGSYGPLERTRAYWHWLLLRHGFDQLYVALDGPNLWDFEEVSTRIIGYAAIQGGRIVELLTAPGRRRAAIELVGRVCGDAIEQGRQGVVLHGPAASGLLAIFVEAGGRPHDGEAYRDEVYMARLLDPVGLMRRSASEFVRRAREARLPCPIELGLLVDGRKYQIDVTAQSANAVANQLGRSYLRLNVADFTRLVLGQLDWDRALEEGRLVASTALAREAGRVLFPSLPLWRPPLDDLTA
jgi:GNAT superfamily N-acetyltransferase